jgi:hypothetical protein
MPISYGTLKKVDSGDKDNIYLVQSQKIIIKPGDEKKPY